MNILKAGVWHGSKAPCSIFASQVHWGVRLESERSPSGTITSSATMVLGPWLLIFGTKFLKSGKLKSEAPKTKNEIIRTNIHHAQNVAGS